MTIEQKMVAIVKRIKEEFPNGCNGIDCKDCPLKDSKEGTYDRTICNMFATVEGKNLW